MGIDINSLSPAMRRQVLAQMGKQTRLDPIRGKDVHVPEESPLETRFLSLWESASGPELNSQVALVPGRLFRCDFLHADSRTVIEIQGYRDHSSRKGFARDNEKHLLLFLRGYTVLTLDRAQITAENVEKIVARCYVEGSK